MNRGSGGRGSGCGRLAGASMRPRFMNRGSWYGDRGRGAEGRCFNEAPIHESGKFSAIAAPQDKVLRLQ